MSKDKGGKKEVKKPKKAKLSKAPHATMANITKPAESK